MKKERTIHPSTSKYCSRNVLLKEAVKITGFYSFFKIYPVVSFGRQVEQGIKSGPHIIQCLTCLISENGTVPNQTCRLKKS